MTNRQALTLSDLKLERAKQVLRAAREHAELEFVGKMADMALLLMEPMPSVEMLNDDIASELAGELTSAIDDLAEQAAKPLSELKRSDVFWALFALAKIRLAGSFVKRTFQPVDVELRSFIDAHRLQFIADEKIRIDHLLGGLPRDLITSQVKAVLASLEKGAEGLAEPLKSENARADTALNALMQLEGRAQKLNALLKDQAEKLNFIGLSQGFKQLADETQAALKSPLFWLRICAGAMLVTPGISLIAPKLSVLDGYEWWQIGIPVLAAELALFYFFRVLLLRYQSLSAQLLQIKLRFSLCAFVEGYSDFASRVRKSADDRTLDRFEALIFSGITPDPQNVPSQFDGIDQVTNLLKALAPGK
ncbi:MAG: hypothetical protein HYX47_23525 [Burkholderiales bacterium]|nr:hypothetical protein [Burkholderiales bacterium]